jgi:putative membrane protein insertion efficiency factor
MIRILSRAVTLPLIALIRAYQLLLSPLLGPRCRFAPGCSTYAVEALTLHGPIYGTWLAAKRIARCHPWGGSGFDPVPAARACTHEHLSGH